MGSHVGVFQSHARMLLPVCVEPKSLILGLPKVDRFAFLHPPHPPFGLCTTARYPSCRTGYLSVGLFLVAPPAASIRCPDFTNWIVCKVVSKHADYGGEFNWGCRIRETDCLVYQVLDGAATNIRSAPSIGDDVRTNRSIEAGELVSVDLVRPGTDGNNGPFLRLSDDSGWLFGTKKGKRVMKPIPVSDGLWTFYAYNPPTGIAPRWHPIDRQEVKIGGCFSTMRKIYCDKKVVHPDNGVNFYRVQGTRRMGI